jgi:PST family polysaccharide transporter
LRIGISLFLVAYIARYLGPERFGLLNYAIALVSLTTPVIALGLNRLLVRDLVRDETDAAELMGSAFWLKLLVSVVTVLALVAAVTQAGLGPTEARGLIAIVALGNLFVAFDVIEFYFQSRVEARYAAICKAAAFFLTSALRFALVYFEAPLVWFAVAYSLEWFLIGLFAVLVYQRQAGGIGAWKLRLARGLAMVRESWPEIGAGLATMFCYRLDQLMLEAMVGVETVGVYSTAARLTDMWYFVPAAIVSTTFPAIVRAREGSPEDYHGSLQNLFTVLAAMGYAVAIPATLLAPWVVDLLFGAAYAGAGPLLMIYVWALLAVSFGLCSGSWIFSEGRIMLNLQRMLLGAGCNVVLNWLLIGLFGAPGAAVATVVSLFVAFLLFDALVPAMRPLFVMKLRALLLLDLAPYIRTLRSRE